MQITINVYMTFNKEFQTDKFRILYSNRIFKIWYQEMNIH